MKLFIDANLMIYMLTKTPDEAERLVEFYADLVYNHALYTNPLVLDETIHVSRKRYKVPYKTSLQFIDEKVIPYVKILPLTILDYLTAKEIILKYNLRPSDALHVATIQNNGLQAIVSEDEDFDKLPIKRLWLEV
ncbi:type II toxin-antitoxin system VapC family toxin [Thermococcus sp. Bubb.Bath]|uniref:type II toxin-antitoxin system VapC family toxin n=1 Tax=Thermococcus sp. Bubb.Bath TaxID=1638242 RepID=UPI00143A5D43|nr:type II toxin-antitoxin system VapC family toxin [Thermococcus sp. Bubb.Bath]NJF24087.1 PIN domain-containing protein [Thermococcus sp. Bubb.Bath]